MFDAAKALDDELQKPVEKQSINIDEFETALDEVVESISQMKQQEEITAKAQEQTQDGTKPPPLDIEKITAVMSDLSQQIAGLSFDAEGTFTKLKPLLTGVDSKVNE